MLCILNDTTHALYRPVCNVIVARGGDFAKMAEIIQQDSFASFVNRLLSLWAVSQRTDYSIQNAILKWEFCEKVSKLIMFGNISPIVEKSNFGSYRLSARQWNDKQHWSRRGGDNTEETSPIIFELVSKKDRIFSPPPRPPPRRDVVRSFRGDLCRPNFFDTGETYWQKKKSSRSSK